MSKLFHEQCKLMPFEVFREIVNKVLTSKTNDERVEVSREATGSEPTKDKEVLGEEEKETPRQRAEREVMDAEVQLKEAAREK